MSAETIEPGSNDTWVQDATITDPSTACVLTANEIITINIQVTAEDDEFVRISEIEFEYDT